MQGESRTQTTTPATAVPPPEGLTAGAMAAIAASTFFGLAVLYAPQPILPRLAAAFGASTAEAASIITWSLFPMSLAPLLMGLLMQAVAPRRLVAACMAGLALTEVVIFLSRTFVVLLLMRFAQGALVAALLAALMTYIALRARRLRRVMAIYVASSVVGGLGGRLLTGWLAEGPGWTVAFLALGGAALLCAVAAWHLPPEPKGAAVRAPVQLRKLFDAFRRPLVRRLYGVVFLAFFTFTALLNFLPFRLGDLDGGVSDTTVALTYSGFLVAMTASLYAPRIAEWLRSEHRAMRTGLLILLMGILAAGWPSLVGAVLAVTGVATGFFLTHAVLSGYLNDHARGEAASLNSLYVASYYLGGTIGSIAPGFIYTAYGWPAFLGTLAALPVGALALLWSARSAMARPGSPFAD